MLTLCEGISMLCDDDFYNYVQRIKNMISNGVDEISLIFNYDKEEKFIFTETFIQNRVIREYSYGFRNIEPKIGYIHYSILYGLQEMLGKIIHNTDYLKTKFYIYDEDDYELGILYEQQLQNNEKSYTVLKFLAHVMKEHYHEDIDYDYVIENISINYGKKYRQCVMCGNDYGDIIDSILFTLVGNNKRMTLEVELKTTSQHYETICEDIGIRCNGSEYESEKITCKFYNIRRVADL